MSRLGWAHLQFLQTYDEIFISGSLTAKDLKKRTARTTECTVTLRLTAAPTSARTRFRLRGGRRTHHRKQHWPLEAAARHTRSEQARARARNGHSPQIGASARKPPHQPRRPEDRQRQRCRPRLRRAMTLHRPLQVQPRRWQRFPLLVRARSTLL